MQPSRSAAVGSNVVAQPHLDFVVLPPHRGCSLIKVLPVEPDARQGVLSIAQTRKCEEDTLQSGHKLMQKPAPAFHRSSLCDLKEREEKKSLRHEASYREPPDQGAAQAFCDMTRLLPVSVAMQILQYAAFSGLTKACKAS